MKNKIIDLAREVLQSEADSLMNLKQFIDDDFVKSVEAILHAKGRLIITGIGKSAIIAQKLTATFNSTGTPSIFMHAADAIHGDLGIIQKDDIVMCISKSGNTPEILVLVPFIRMNGNTLIGMAGNDGSFLAKESDFFLNCSVEKESCPHNLAPTNSSTAQLALGDALAACLIEMRGFTPQDFAKYHPGGMLGKRLYLKVADAFKFNEVPEVSEDAPLQQIILEISSKRLGVTAVVKGNRVIGSITDGDLRRMLEKNIESSRIQAKDIMSLNPKKIRIDALAIEAFELMKKSNITNLFVVNESDEYKGVIHLHDLIREGIY